MRRALVVLVLVMGCGDNSIPLIEVCSLVDADGNSSLVELSTDGEYLLFRHDKGLFVTSTVCGSTPVLIGGLLESPQFCGDAVLAFAGVGDDYAARLVAWTPGLDRGVDIALKVDPDATHCSADGRYASIEEDDQTGDGNPDVTLALVRTADLVVRTVWITDRPRGRFTHDSHFLVYSGSSLGTQPETQPLMRVAVDGGTAERIGTIEHTRWQISNDDQWIILSATGGVLRKQPLCCTDGTVDLATGVMDLPGQDFAMIDDDLVAYLDNGMLEVVPVAGGAPTVLDSGLDPLAFRFVTHAPGFLEYQRAGTSRVISTAGGRGPVLATHIADHIGDQILLTRSEGTIGGTEALRVTAAAPVPASLATNLRQMAFTYDGRVFGDDPARLAEIHIAYPYEVPLVTETLFPFVVDSSHRFFVAAVPAGNAAAFMRVELPVPGVYR